MVNEDEAKLVRRIFEMYLKEKSMPQVAFDLNNAGIQTKQGKKWNARAVRGILTNEIYIGKYNVAGVNHYVEEYKIMDENSFWSTNKMRLRYKMGGAERPPMPQTRKTAKVDRVFNEFLKLLNSQEEDMDESVGYKIRVIRNEKELFRLLTEGWSLMKMVDDKFVVRENRQERKA